MPIIASIHILEEWFGGFLSQMEKIIKGVTATQFWMVNAAFLAFCIVAGLMHRRRPVLLLSAVALIGVNTLIHTAASVVLGTYSPGLISALALYLPLTVWTFRSALIKEEVTGSQAMRAVLLGVGLMTAPMIFQGIRILFGL
jgi:hypothetical protein